MKKYIVSVDQSTQSTKAILFDEKGDMIKRVDKKHHQIINELGYVSHDPMEIYQNTIHAVTELIRVTNIDKSQIYALGISNQRETTVMWDKEGNPYTDAVVWQCNRAKDIAVRYADYKDEIYEITGLPLSPYFPACKMRWLIEAVCPSNDYYLGTIDAWLVYKLTRKQSFKTDASNASRTQLFDIHTGTWSKRLCDLFAIPIESLPEVCDSNSCFGYTDFEGFLSKPIPILSVLGDSHAALFGQGCHSKGQVKTTLGTGSSIMMNIGSEYKKSLNGLATSLAWRIDGKPEYVYEGNINYAGAVITWLINDLEIISNPKQIDSCVEKANSSDETVLVPAFSGLSAPYWNDEVRAMFYGMSRTTGKNELVKASVESIAYQIADILIAMSNDSNIEINQLKADGGPSKNIYLMQFLSDMARTTVSVSKQEELSAIGAAYLAGITANVYKKDELFASREYTNYSYQLPVIKWEKKKKCWQNAIKILLRER